MNLDQVEFGKEDFASGGRADARPELNLRTAYKLWAVVIGLGLRNGAIRAHYQPLRNSTGGCSLEYPNGATEPVPFPPYLDPWLEACLKGLGAGSTSDRDEGRGEGTVTRRGVGEQRAITVWLEGTDVNVAVAQAGEKTTLLFPEKHNLTGAADRALRRMMESFSASRVC